DLVADRLHVAKLVEGQVAGLADESAVDEERAPHPEALEQGEGAGLIRAGDVELDRDEGPRAGVITGLHRCCRRGERREDEQRRWC
ncbi:MAG: hypothetical protein ABIO51_00310, partial [Solirubrobacteraceae bacterium]